MKNRLFGSFVAVCFFFPSIFLMAGGQTAQELATEESVTAAIPDIEHGFYNIDEFERVTDTKITTFSEAPMLKARVESGDLRSVEERLPDNPLVMIPLEEVGKYGGTLRIPNFRPASPTVMNLHVLRPLNQPPYGTGGTFWFVGPRSFRKQPGLFESWEVSADARTHTFTIRKGLKWSDGAPVTTEDVEYALNDLTNTDLFASPTSWLRWEAEAGEVTMTLQIVDKYTFSYVFDHPFPGFNVGADVAPFTWDRYIQPAHYLKQFHPDHASWSEIEPVMDEKGFKTREEWPKFYLGMRVVSGANRARQLNGTEQPTLDPYLLSEQTDAGDFLWERNPYYCIVDTAGNQLPYIDRIHNVLVSDKNVSDLKLMAGEVDMDGHFETIADYPLFAENQEAGGYEILLPRHPSSQILLYLINSAHADPEIRKITSDLRFRAALSHALDRDYIKETIMKGTGRAAQLAASPTGPYYEEGMEEAYADYDPDKARRLLDEMGLIDVDGDGWRDRLDGKPFVFRLEYQITQAPVEGTEVAKRFWEDVGIKVDIKQITGVWQLITSYELMVTIWHSAGTGAPRDPWFLGFSVSTRAWADWYNTNGEKGIEPPEWAITLLDSQIEFLRALSEEDATEAATRAWRMQAENIPVLGTVTDVAHPFVFTKKLGNIKRAEELDWDSNAILCYGDQYFFKDEQRRGQ